MELIFTITAGQRQALQPLVDRVAKEQTARLQARVADRLRRHQDFVDAKSRLLLLVMPLAVAALIPIIQGTIEACIAFAIVAVFYSLLWRLFSKPLLRQLRQISMRINAKLMTATADWLTRIARRKLMPLAGVHCWALLPQAASVRLPTGKIVVIAWATIAQAFEWGDFHMWVVRRRGMLRFTQRASVFYLAKHSTEMAEAEYHERLTRLLQHAPQPIRAASPHAENAAQTTDGQA